MLGRQCVTNEVRRHYYVSCGVPMKIKIKTKTKVPGDRDYVQYYRMFANGAPIGWQDKKPDDYRDIPYVTAALDPFDPELRGNDILWPEGEKDVDGLSKVNVPAFTFGGTGDGLPDGIDHYFKDRRIVIPADNDDPGRRHAEKKAARAHAAGAASIKIVHFLELREKGDVSDFIAGGGTVDQLNARIDAAPIWSPPASDAPSKSAAAPNGKLLVVHDASLVRPAPIQWVWPGRIAIGKTTLVGGDPGLGKSQFSIFVASTISQGGEWPCKEGGAPKRSVIMLSVEDGLADTIVPRLMAADADLQKIKVVTAVHAEDGTGRRIFNLTQDLDVLEGLITKLGDVGLVVIDPVDAYIGGNVDTHKNAAVRAVLEPISEMADRLGVAILAITHFSKQVATKAIYRFIGSIAHVGAARFAFGVVSDPDDKTRVLLLQAKVNITSPQKGLAFRIEQHLVADDIIGSSVFFEPKHVTDLSADEALSTENGAGATAKEDWIDFLQSMLAAGARLVREIEREARDCGLLGDTTPISQCKPARAARKALGVEVQKDGMRGGWVWFLAPKVPSGSEDALQKERAPSGGEGTFGGPGEAP
jgi:hypothetical protein